MSKILLIEDDPTMQQLYKRAFVLAGDEITIANDGIEGLEKVKLSTPDLIFLDIMMPKMNGTELLSILKNEESTKHIPVVMLTNVASGTLKTAEEAVNNGAISYIIKSDHDPKELVELARKVLRSLG